MSAPAPTSSNPMAAGQSWAVAWLIAKRELRTGAKGFGAFLACIALGVAAIAAVGVVNDSVISAVQRDARTLLGGDIALDVASMPLAEAEIAAIAPEGAVRSDIATTTAIASGAPRADGEPRRAVLGVKAVDDAYPLLGEAVLAPAMPIQEAIAGDGVVMEEIAAQRLGVAVGDRFRLGEMDFTLTAILVREPDGLRNGFVNVGPRTIMRRDALEASGALAPGSVARFGHRFLLPEGGDVAAAFLAMQDADARYRVRTASDIQPQIQRFTDRLGGFLTLSGFTALLVGGLGVALGVSSHLASKNKTIATLKSIGADGPLIFKTYFLQIAMIAALGVAIGVTLGQLLPTVLPALVPEGALPVRLEIAFQPLPLAFAAACGFLAAFAFTVPALARARDASPAALFRAIVAPPRFRWRGQDGLVLAAAAVGLALLALIGVARPEIGFFYVAVAAAATLAIILVGRATVKALAAFGKSRGPFWRLAIGGVAKPGSSAVTAITATGAGLAALAAVGMIESNLSKEVDSRLSNRAPDLVLIDVQPDQKPLMDQLVAETEGAAFSQVQPVVRARVSHIDGVPVSEVAIGEGSRWTVRRERALTWSDGPWINDDQPLTDGYWWEEGYDGPTLVSMEDEIAWDYGVGVGDTITFNILGRPIEAEIANLRPEIDWGSTGRLDFVFVLTPGAIEQAPHIYLAALDADEQAVEAIIDGVADTMPNVTPLNIGDLAERAAETMAKIGLAIKIVGGVTLLAGAFVLAGAAAAERRRRLQEAVILKMLGATRKDVVSAFGLEFSLLGLVAAIAGLAVGAFGAWLATTQLLQLEWSFDPTTAILTIVLALGMALMVGARTIWGALGVSAAEALRAG